LAEVNEDTATCFLGRYLPEESYFSKTKNAVKPKAFIPFPHLKLSTCCIDNLDSQQIWALGREVIKAMNKPNLYGVGKIATSVIREEKLTILIEGNEKITAHRNICGWPDDKSKQHLIADVLAAQAELILNQ
jgi:hypothetical protein